MGLCKGNSLVVVELLLLPPADVLLVLPEVFQGLLLAEVVQRREVPRRHVLRHVRVAVGLCKTSKVYGAGLKTEHGLREISFNGHFLSPALYN